jgi:hypothetical protein
VSIPRDFRHPRLPTFRLRVKRFGAKQLGIILRAISLGLKPIKARCHPESLGLNSQLTLNPIKVLLLVTPFGLDLGRES